MRWLVAVAIAATACGNDSDRREARNVPADPAAPVAVHVDAAPPPGPAPETGSPRAWFEDYRAAHADATPATAIDTGTKIWQMLADDAHQQLLALAATMAAKLPTIHVGAQELAYKMLGETAAVRAPMMRVAKITSDQTTPPRQVGGHTVPVHALRIEGNGQTLALDIINDGTGWKLAAGPSLTVDESDVFKAPSSGKDAPVGLPTLDAVVARWKEIVASGNGWDALNIMSPAMHAQLLQLIARMGGDGMPDVARIMEKTLVDRRNRGVTVTATKIDSQTADRGQFTFTYSTGTTDTFTAVRSGAAWWLEVKL